MNLIEGRYDGIKFSSKPARILVKSCHPLGALTEPRGTSAFGVSFKAKNTGLP